MGIWNPWNPVEEKSETFRRVQHSSRTTPTYLVQTYHPLIEYADPSIMMPLDDSFVDGGIRREPSLEHEMPGITSICRGSTFAPSLIPGDHIIYFTTKQSHSGSPSTVNYLVAALRIEKTFRNHQDAAAYYRKLGKVLPVNCMVKGTSYRILGNVSMGNHKAQDNFYAARVKANPIFHVCKKMKANLHNPKGISEQQLIKLIGRNKMARNCMTITKSQFTKLLTMI